MSFKITPVATKKTKIKQRLNAIAGRIPKHPNVSLFAGSQGSGKTTLLVNLLEKKQFYGKIRGKHYFDKIVLFTNSDDDAYDVLIEKGILDENLIKFNPSEGDIQHLIDFQNNIIKERGIFKSPKILVIFEDIVSNQKLMRSKPFLECFVKPRHLNFSVWILTQYINIVPRVLRMQANHIFSFRGNKAEVEILEDQYTPADCCKKCFRQMIKDATTPEENDEYPFLHISKSSKIEKRFRRNLEFFITKNCDHV